MQHVRKVDGNKEAFDEKKLHKSLKRSGASAAEITQVIDTVKKIDKSEISSAEIHDLAFDILKNIKGSTAARYSLKRAIMALGPSGFPFEKFIAEIFTRLGYTTKIGIVMPGKCVNHEVDIEIENDSDYFLAECKYHNSLEIITGIKIPLYVHARYNDIISMKPEKIEKNCRAWVITNTRLSDDAVKYAECSGMNYLSWNQPYGKSIKDLADQAHLYPLTCLTSLSNVEKSQLLKQGLVMSTDLLYKVEVLHHIGLSDYRIKKTLEEIASL